ncbi:MAG: GH13 / GH13_10 / GH13_9 / GH13_11 / GH13_36 [uncultured Gemmatimonadetes bacterium]|uniref:1,4-alpha-glucan branching enzyme n=1 Tax=uncultured Gemmatimonadota bacterium TaxID=203437 RepID=A0A6J4KZI0_9BACT|nr:MAG: GH13 / GH13_10 / GH13_9 / GH13_11 / GH13_36 [uncultured Gemmatimonadota bacterium]
MTTVRFIYLTGQKRSLFRNARLKGSWDAAGRYSGEWTESPMQEIVAEDGCPAFVATVRLHGGAAGEVFRWGVVLDGPAGANQWGIITEAPGSSAKDQRRYREFRPRGGTEQDERYYLTWSRRLGAQKLYTDPVLPPAIRFSVWAPNATAAEVVFSPPAHGYIADDGTGIDPARPPIPMARGDDDIFESAPVPDFAAFAGAPYMFRIVNAQGDVVYRTDLHSRWQIGRGDQNPRHGGWNGDPATLDGGVGCSVVIDQDVVRREFEPPAGSPPVLVADDEFWSREFTPGLPVPTRVEDLVIYEMHAGSLGFGRPGAGTLADAVGLLDHLVELGVTAVELLPISEFSGTLGWGYGDTHHFVIESSAGGRDKYKYFVRECHRRGIAVIQDVVYNHFDNDAERAEWQYDSTQPEENIYYWYEGSSAQYPRPDGGYLDNGSSGFTPRFWEEPVRHLFISSAAEFVEEFHVDGLRVDLTQAIHRDHALHANGWGVSRANELGQQFLREWSRTLRLIRPGAMLIAEDHSGWDAVTKMPSVGGLGFDSTWFAAFYHNLIGDADMGRDAARLLHQAGQGDERPVAMGRFSSVLEGSRFDKVVYHESHDEAGNAGGSMRTSRTAVNGAELWGATRDYAEARCRVVTGLSVLSAGTPMFFMGEEIVAQNIYKFDNVESAKEDLLGERRGNGARMFRFYQELIRLRRRHPAIRSREIDVIHAHDANRVIAFTRRKGENELLVVASLNNQPFAAGYVLDTSAQRLPGGLWQEIFNSDSATYGGSGLGNFSASLPCDNGRIDLRIPANGFVVLQKR